MEETCWAVGLVGGVGWGGGGGGGGERFVWFFLVDRYPDGCDGVF